MPKKDNRLPEVLTKEEIKKMIESADNQKSKLISFLDSFLTPPKGTYSILLSSKIK